MWTLVAPVTVTYVSVCERSTVSVDTQSSCTRIVRIILNSTSLITKKETILPEMIPYPASDKNIQNLLIVMLLRIMDYFAAREKCTETDESVFTE